MSGKKALFCEILLALGIGVVAGAGCGESHATQDLEDASIETDADMDSDANVIAPDCGCSDDSDSDGSPDVEDCDDNNPLIHPGAEESCCDMIDSNCDGLDDPENLACNCAYDADMDGYYIGFTGGERDCNDNDATIHPGAQEVCCDNVDQDCDGEVDLPICNCLPETE